MSEVLSQKDRALKPDELVELLQELLPQAITRTTDEYGILTIWVDNPAWAQLAHLVRSHRLLAFDFFDNLFGIDAGDAGFDVVTVLYSTTFGTRIALRTRCLGGRDEPTCPSLTDIYRGADWMERETWDMFGIEFDGHPSLAPRILTVENFEGWPLRKDFHLTSRVVKPWPGVKEPAELDEDGNVIERVPEVGDAPGPYDLDQAMAEQAKLRRASAAGAIVEDAEVVPTTERAAVDAPQPSDPDAAAQADADPAAGADSGASEAAPQIDAEPDEAAAADAKRKADERRRSQAEARAKKAAERARKRQSNDGGSDDGGSDEPPSEGEA